jgi:protein SCO1/2
MLMKQRKLILFVLLVIGIPVLAFFIVRHYESGYAPLQFYGPVSSTTNDEIAYHKVPPFLFTDQDNQLISLDDTDGKVFVANFFFTSCPTICPRMTRNLQSVQELYRNDQAIMFLSFTVDPKRDTPERMRAFAEKYQANTPQWRFLTGEKKALYTLARNGFFLSASEGDGGPGDFIHSENLILVDRQNHIRGYYNGTDESAVEQLVKDITKLKRSNS